MLDPVSDMLTRVRNAQAIGKEEVLIPASKMKTAIAELLVKEDFAEASSIVENEGHPSVRLTLKYEQKARTRKEPSIKNIERVSTEGQRVYVKRDDIRKVRSGLGLAVISTSKGIMSGEEAYRKGLGGEYICKVW